MPVVKTGEEKDYSRLRKMVIGKQAKELVRSGAKTTTIVALIFLMNGLFSTKARAQDSTTIKTVLSLEYLNSDGTHILTGKLSAKKDGKYVPVEGMKLDFSYVSGDVKKLMGTEVTGAKGKASVLG